MLTVYHLFTFNTAISPVLPLFSNTTAYKTAPLLPESCPYILKSSKCYCVFHHSGHWRVCVINESLVFVACVIDCFLSYLRLIYLYLRENTVGEKVLDYLRSGKSNCRSDSVIGYALSQNITIGDRWIKKWEFSTCMVVYYSLVNY